MTRVSFVCFALWALVSCTPRGGVTETSGGEDTSAHGETVGPDQVEPRQSEGTESEDMESENTESERTESENTESERTGSEHTGDVEGGSALGTPPSTEVDTDVRAVAQSDVTEPTPASAPPAVTRPTMILAPARSGRVRLSDVHGVIREHRPEVTACYEEGLARDHSLSGTAKVRFLIGPRGRIENAEVYETTLGDEVVEACILEAMRSWRFPRPRPRRSSVLLTYPYLLSTE